MKERHVFSTDSLADARVAMQSLRAAGIDDADISLIARSDVEMEKIPDDRKVVDMDFIPASLRGTLGGGAAGLLAGLVAVVIPPLGVTLAGAGALALAGAMLGTWSGAMVGGSIPDAVRRTFEAEIAAGKVLVVVDGDEAALERAEAALSGSNARLLPFAAPTALT